MLHVASTTIKTIQTDGMIDSKTVIPGRPIEGHMDQGRCGVVVGARKDRTNPVTVTELRGNRVIEEVEVERDIQDHLDQADTKVFLLAILMYQQWNV